MAQFESSYARLGVGLLWAALIVSAVEVVYNWHTDGFDVAKFVVELILFLIWWGLTAMVAAGISWARTVYLIIAVFAVLFFVLVTAMILHLPDVEAAIGLVALLFAWLPPILAVLGLLLVFGETSSGAKIGLVFVLAVTFVAGIAALGMPSAMKSFDTDPRFALLKVVFEIRHQHRFPEKIDDDTEAIDVGFQKGMLIYGYRLVKVNANGFDREGFVDRMTPVLTQRFCGQEGHDLIKQGVVVRTYYVDKSQAPLVFVDVDSSDCEAAAANETAHHEVWKKYVPQASQSDAQPETPWRTGTSEATPTATPAKRVYQPVETPEMKAQALVDEGTQQMHQGNYDAAIKDFKAALALNPDNYAARSGLQEAQHMR